jgi:plasmid replication initiation protein
VKKEMKVFNNKKDPVVLKTNALVDAQYHLTLPQHRLIYCCLAQIQPKSEVSLEYSVHASDYAKLYGITISAAYKQLESAASSLFESEIVIRDKLKGKKTRMRWVYKIDYNEGEGKVTLGFSPKILPHISMLEQSYVTLGLNMTKKFKKTYAFRLYELASRYSFRGDKYCDVDDFREMLGITDKYDRWYDIEISVLKPACREISANTNMSLSYKTHKKGKKTIGVTLFFSDSRRVVSLAKLGVAKYEKLGYRMEHEYIDSLEIQKNHNVVFENADEYIRFKIKMSNDESDIEDMFD